jgi:hypothetical protein
MHARDITRCRDDATRAAPNNHGLVGKRGIVALLDRGVESIAINMGERQFIPLGMIE